MPQLKLDEAKAVEEVEARMEAAADASSQAAQQAGGGGGGAPGGGGPALSGRTVSNLQLEVLASRAQAEEAGDAGDGGTGQTLLELCSSEGLGFVEHGTWPAPPALPGVPAQHFCT